jgi:hypothetical protein
MINILFTADQVHVVFKSPVAGPQKRPQLDQNRTPKDRTAVAVAWLQKRSSCRLRPFANNEEPVQDWLRPVFTQPVAYRGVVLEQAIPTVVRSCETVKI